MKMNLTTVNAGLYYLGDLKFVLEKYWDEVVEKTNNFQKQGKFKLDNTVEFVVYKAENGKYHVYQGKTIDVENNNVGIVKLTQIKKALPMKAVAIMLSDEKNECYIDENKVIHFGSTIKVKKIGAK